MSRSIQLIGILITVGITVFSCQNRAEKNKTMDINAKDPHSLSRPDEAVVKHLDLDLNIDFEQKKIEGTVEIEYEKNSEAQYLILDTKKLQIIDVLFSDGEQAKYTLLEEDPLLGSALKISLTNAGNKVIIKYVTSKHAEALQWLDPKQTADKTAPYLFTQSQAILARSWIPLQDSPGVRFTYTASVHVPPGFLVLMSAENPQKVNEDGNYHFRMDQPIPSYLMALVVGEIGFAPVGERTGVYAEPSMLQKSKEEFSEMEDMLSIAEKLYGDYRWDRYDLIVLPPSFPFGGMENPRITFATPTIITGDKSLTSLVAHELAHSWSGNLVTNATWNDFWLNEGFTVYFESRIMEALKGKDYEEMLSSLSMMGLLEEVDLFMKTGKENDTKLKLDLAGRNPDDGLTTIAYDKGYFFLKYLEQYAGREKFDDFMNKYFSEFAFKSNYTEAFMEYLNENLFEKNKITPPDDLEEWVYGVGLPESLPKVTSARFIKVDQAIDDWKNGKVLDVTTIWSSHEWVYFIKNIPEDVSQMSLALLDNKYDFTNSGNAEILGVWYVHCAKHLYAPSFSAMERFLIHTGRRKFLMPIYEALVETDEGRSLAISIYKKARPNYHFVATNSLDKLLN